MDVFQRTSSMVSLPLVQGVPAVQLCGSGMFANKISNLLRSASSAGNLLQQTATTGDRLSEVVRGRQKKKDTNSGRRRESVGERGYRLPRLYIKLSTPVPSVTETATKKIGRFSHSRCGAKHRCHLWRAPLSPEIHECQ